eukprot:4727699-Pleurochrysis_carterae.AAC.3
MRARNARANARVSALSPVSSMHLVGASISTFISRRSCKIALTPPTLDSLIESASSAARSSAGSAFSSAATRRPRPPTTPLRASTEPMVVSRYLRTCHVSHRYSWRW